MDGSGPGWRSLQNRRCLSFLHRFPYCPYSSHRPGSACFAALPDSLRWGLALLLAFALLASLLPFLRLRWPDRQQAERRLERINQIPHQAIGALDDRPVTETAFARALFDRHRQRMAASIDGLEPGIPQPDISRF